MNLIPSTTRNHHDGLSPVLTVTLISGQDQVEAEVVEYEYSQSDLEIMTETELEDICIKRGFQLVNDDLDPETGEKYSLTKQDYVEAAQRCLAIEKEMNELLVQYPELADELEEEIKRMEEENLEKQAKVDELKSEIGGSNNNVEETVDSTSGNDNNDGGQEQDDTPGMAFTRGKEATNNDDNNEDENENDDINESIDDDIASGKESTTASATTIIDEVEENDILSATITNNAITGDDIIGKDMESSSDDTLLLSDTADGGKNAEDFTLSHLAVESLRVLVKNASEDVKRVIGLAIPVFQPLLNAGDVAWKQIKSLYAKARKAYDAYQATNNQSSSSSSSSSSNKETPEDSAGSESESCEDPISNSN
ncbi:hypothetical protein FRACYDRAFT_248453 [Fragilariopsis cylindrus CCMP1102]|uniref:Uncharacterized protein n=1 Tax=Fragilariopsis cylindrus CCMP1102 TaxID=635003 RepID=A0A1E7EUX4_9STRA|nr:hypothetical protein FRACYDRAFT_248453 [Fragilariopsis cylindrus CCMP1102]|eukprot:OEU09605.1 hypothetical protein FRACYDRAFT_248453 [Fragilariopsis cylindrus CCMP1102]